MLSVPGWIIRLKAWHFVNMRFVYICPARIVRRENELSKSVWRSSVGKVADQSMTRVLVTTCYTHTQAASGCMSLTGGQPVSLLIAHLASAHPPSLETMHRSIF